MPLIPIVSYIDFMGSALSFKHVRHTFVTSIHTFDMVFSDLQLAFTAAGPANLICHRREPPMI